MKQHERSLMAKKSEAGGVGTVDPLKTPGTEGEMGAEDPHQIVAEHGPATHTMTEHPGEGAEGGHMAHSMHPDGHEYHSEHKDGKSAHEHAMCLSGDCAHGGGGDHEPDGDEAQFE